jgi:hypothetical protein
MSIVSTKSWRSSRSLVARHLTVPIPREAVTGFDFSIDDLKYGPTNEGNFEPTVDTLLEF